jgi:hypothetical protein
MRLSFLIPTIAEVVKVGKSLVVSALKMVMTLAAGSPGGGDHALEPAPETLTGVVRLSPHVAVTGAAGVHLGGGMHMEHVLSHHDALACLGAESVGAALAAGGEAAEQDGTSAASSGGLGGRPRDGADRAHGGGRDPAVSSGIAGSWSGP